MGEPKHNPQHDQQHEQQSNDKTSDYFERRSRSDKERDRRVIERVSVPEMRPFLTLLRSLCRVAVGFSVIYLGALLAGHLYPVVNFDSSAKSVFIATVVFSLIYNFARLASSITSYLENESKQRLLALMERFMRLMFVSITIGVILGAVHIITWIK